VLEAASLCVRLGFVDGKRVLEEALGEAVTANDVPCALAADGSELCFSVLQRDQMQIGHA